MYTCRCWRFRQKHHYQTDEADSWLRIFENWKGKLSSHDIHQFVGINAGFVREHGPVELVIWQRDELELHWPVWASCQLVSAVHTRIIPSGLPSAACVVMERQEHTGNICARAYLCIQWKHQIVSGIIHTERICRLSHAYLPSFFDQLDRLFQPDYTPTDPDIIHCRIKTTGKMRCSICEFHVCVTSAEN